VAKRYVVKLAPAAIRDFKRLDIQPQRRLRPHIDTLADNPHPTGVNALQCDSSILRIRIGSCRILYTVKDQELIVLVLKIGDRKKVYR
jgi:mRNA interferase RelE/StbE